MKTKTAPKTTVTQRVSPENAERLDGLIERLSSVGLGDLEQPVEFKKSNLLDALLTLKSDEEIAAFLGLRESLAGGLRKNFGDFSLMLAEEKKQTQVIDQAFKDSAAWLRGTLSEFLALEVRKAISEAIAEAAKNAYEGK